MGLDQQKIEEYRKEYRLVVEDTRKRIGYTPKLSHNKADEEVFVLFRMFEDLDVQLRRMESRINELYSRTAGQIVVGGPQRHGLPPP